MIKEFPDRFPSTLFRNNSIIVSSEFERGDFVYGKDKLVEKTNERIDVTKRQTLEVAEFKKLPGTKHNTLYHKKAIENKH